MGFLVHRLLGQTRSAVLGNASFADLARALAPAQATLRREVNPTVMTRGEFLDKLAAAVRLVATLNGVLLR